MDGTLTSTNDVNATSTAVKGLKSAAGSSVSENICSPPQFLVSPRLLKKSAVTSLCLLSLVLLVKVTWRLHIKPIVPPAWVGADPVQLYHIVRDFQDFDVDEPILVGPGNEPGIVWPNMTFFEELVSKRQSEFHHRNKHRQWPSHRVKATVDITFHLFEQFQPIMNPIEFARLIFTMDTFARACSRGRLIYFMTEASLMGALRHHGIIPWDDDIDVAMSARQWREIRNVLGNIQGFQLYSPRASQWKFFMSSATSFPDKHFKFPYIDIFFYDEDDSHVWAVTKGLKHDLLHKKSDVFPLQLRPFEHLFVKVPCNLDLLVHKSHDVGVCVTPEYIHKTNRNVKRHHEQTSVPCTLLYDVYPFVSVTNSSLPGHVDEYLKVGDRVLHKVTLSLDGCGVVT